MGVEEITSNLLFFILLFRFSAQNKRELFKKRDESERERKQQFPLIALSLSKVSDSHKKKQSVNSQPYISHPLLQRFQNRRFFLCSLQWFAISPRYSRISQAPLHPPMYSVLFWTVFETVNFAKTLSNLPPLVKILGLANTYK